MRRFLKITDKFGIITCLVSFWQGADKVVGVGLDGGLDHSVGGRVAQTIGDVLLHRTSKQNWLLTHQRHLQEGT